MRPHSGQFLSILYGGSLRSVSSLNMEASLCLFHTIWGPLGSFLCILHWGPQITFFAYYNRAPQISFFLYNMGSPLRSVSLFTICPPPPSDQFLCMLYGGPPHILVVSQNIWGGPLRSVSPLTIWGPLRLVSLLTIWGPLISVSVHTFWGPLSDNFFYMEPLQISFFTYYMGSPSDQFLHILYGGPLRSVSSLTI